MNCHFFLNLLLYTFFLTAIYACRLFLSHYNGLLLNDSLAKHLRFWWESDNVVIYTFFVPKYCGCVIYWQLSCLLVNGVFETFCWRSALKSLKLFLITKNRDIHTRAILDCQITKPFLSLKINTSNNKLLESTTRWYTK